MHPRTSAAIFLLIISLISPATAKEQNEIEAFATTMALKTRTCTPGNAVLINTTDGKVEPNEENLLRDVQRVLEKLIHREKSFPCVYLLGAPLAWPIGVYAVPQERGGGKQWIVYNPLSIRSFDIERLHTVAPHELAHLVQVILNNNETHDARWWHTCQQLQEDLFGSATNGGCNTVF